MRWASLRSAPRLEIGSIQFALDADLIIQNALRKNDNNLARAAQALLDSPNEFALSYCTTSFRFDWHFSFNAPLEAPSVAPTTSTKTISPAELKRTCIDLLIECGLSFEEAQVALPLTQSAAAKPTSGIAGIPGTRESFRSCTCSRACH